MFCLHLVAEVCSKSIMYLGYVISLIRKANILADTKNITQPVLEEYLKILSEQLNELSFRQHRESLFNVCVA